MASLSRLCIRLFAPKLRPDAPLIWIGTNSTGDSSWWQPSDLYGTSPDHLTQKEYVHKKEAEEAIKNLKKGEKLDDKLAEMKDIDGFLANLKKYIESGHGKSSFIEKKAHKTEIYPIYIEVAQIAAKTTRCQVRTGEVVFWNSNETSCAIKSNQRVQLKY